MSFNFSNTADFPVIDGHVHYGHPSFLRVLMDVMDQLHVARLNVVCTPHQSRLSLVPDALHLKAHHVASLQSAQSKEGG